MSDEATSERALALVGSARDDMLLEACRETRWEARTRAIIVERLAPANAAMMSALILPETLTNTHEKDPRLFLAASPCM